MNRLANFLFPPALASSLMLAILGLATVLAPASADMRITCITGNCALTNCSYSISCSDDGSCSDPDCDGGCGFSFDPSTGLSECVCS